MPEMDMRRALFWIACCCMLHIVAHEAAGASWDGVQILPKSFGARLVKSAGDTKTVNTVFDIDWPATVAGVDGQWLNIKDPGAYSTGPIDVWVRKDDVTKLDDALGYCTKTISKLTTGNTGDASTSGKKSTAPEAKNLEEVYWLRGIFWENFGNQSELPNAIADYESAAACNPYMGDAYLRLGRTLAQYAFTKKDLLPDGGKTLYELASTNFCKAKSASFDSACGRLQKLAPGKAKLPPQLYVSLAAALVQQYAAVSDPNDLTLAKQSLENYCCAERTNQTWFVPVHGKGHLYLTIANELAPERPSPPKAANRKYLLKAIDYFTRAIRLDPTALAPFRERAEALRRLVGAEDGINQLALPCPMPCDLPSTLDASVSISPVLPLTEGAMFAIFDNAFGSAEQAYLLGNNRQLESMETRARVALAMATTLYPLDVPDAVPPKGKTLTPERRARLTAADAIAKRAADTAMQAGNYNPKLADIERCYVLANVCDDQVAYYDAILSEKIPDGLRAEIAFWASSRKLSGSEDFLDTLRTTNIELSGDNEVVRDNVEDFTEKLSELDADSAAAREAMDEMMQKGSGKEKADAVQKTAILYSKAVKLDEEIKRWHPTIQLSLQVPPPHKPAPAPAPTFLDGPRRPLRYTRLDLMGHQ
jgi:tetratricopeptide (TPR) repeat protein